MHRLYIVPSESYNPGTGVVYYGPLYFAWRFGSGTLAYTGLKKYGFVNGYLVAAELEQADHDWLLTQPNVYVFPEYANIDNPIPPQDDLHDVFETFHVPTDWLTPSSTYREFIQQTNGIFEFGGRYQAIAGQNGAPPQTELWDVLTLDTKYSAFPADVKVWFNLTLESFGFNPALILPNMTMRQMLKTASDQIKTPLTIGGVTY